MAAAEYDVFLSHALADGERPQQLADALTKAGLRLTLAAMAQPLIYLGFVV
jgi:hypothetical protein